MKDYIRLTGIFLLGLACFTSRASAKPPAFSVINETESFKNDKQASQYPLSYRLTLRPCFSTPVVMKLYIKFRPPSRAGGESVAEGLFIVKGIKDGTADTIQSWEKILDDEEVREILDTIRRQEIFNLKPASSFDSPEGSLLDDNPGMDSSSWYFERMSQDHWRNPHASQEYHYDRTSRTVTKYGPASLVWDAFSKQSAELLKTPAKVSE